MKKAKAGALAALAAAALGGCADQVRTSHGDAATFYSRSLVIHAASGGVFPLVVHGNPFPDLPADQAAEAVAREMRLPGWFPQTPFALAPAPGAPSGDYRLVLIFNPARPVGANEACGDLRRIPLASPGPEIQARAAFCAGSDPASDAFGRAPAAPPGSLTFRQFLDQLALAVFPPYNPDLQDDDRPFRFLPVLLRHPG